MKYRPSGEKSAWLTPAQPTGSGLADLHGVRVAEDQLTVHRGHHDGVLAVGREVEVVRVVDLDGLAGLAGRGVDGREVVPPVVVDPERLQVPGRHDVLRLHPHRNGLDDLVGLRVDDRDRVGAGVGDIDPRGEVLDLRRQPARPVRRVEVVLVQQRRHPRQARLGGPGRRAFDRPRAVRGRFALAAAAARRHQRAGHGEQRGPVARAQAWTVVGTVPVSHQVTSSVVVTARRPRRRRPSRIGGSAATVPACPRWRLTTEPGPTASRTVRWTAGAPGSFASRESTS